MDVLRKLSPMIKGRIPTMLPRAIALSVCLVVPLESAQSQSCANPTAPAATRLLARARTLASDTSQAYTIYRDSVLQIPAVPAANVVLVTSDSVCQLAKAAYEALITAQTPHTVTVYVYHIGSDYLVVDPVEFSGTFKVAVLFDSSFVRKGRGNVGM